MRKIHLAVLALAISLLHVNGSQADILEFMPAVLAGANAKPVQINVIPSGPGSFSSDSILSYDYDTGAGITANAYQQDQDKRITLTAQPKSGATIMSWEGCESVSDDLTQCTVPLLQDRTILVHFASSAIDYKPVNLVDLSEARVTISYDSTYIVSGDKTNTALMAKLKKLNSGDYIIGHNNPAFFRRVTSVVHSVAGGLLASTEACTLEDVIASGTLYASKKMTHSDLVSSEGTITTSNGKKLRIKSAPSDSSVFTIYFSEPTDEGGASFENCFSYETDAGLNAKICGKVELEFNLAYSADFSLFGLKQFRFIPEITQTSELSITVEGTPDALTKEVYIGTLQFGKIFSGPFWADCNIEMWIGFAGSFGVSAKFADVIQAKNAAGLTYDADCSPAWALVNTSQYNNNFSKPEVSVDTKAKVYFKATPMLKIMSLTGPAIDVQPYVEVATQFAFVGGCKGLTGKATFGIDGYFTWVMPGSILGNTLGNDDLNDTFKFKIGALYENTLLTWSIDGTCANPDKLKVQGKNFYIAQNEGIDKIYRQTYTLTNDGDTDVNWSFDTKSTLINPSQAQGTVAAHSNANVEVTVSPQILKQGVYDKSFSFKMAQEEKNYYAHIDISAPILESPSITGAQYSSSHITFDWNYYNDILYKYVQGYEIYQSLDGINYTQIAIISDKAVHSYSTNIIPPGVEHWYALVAYGTNGLRSERSSPLTIFGENK
ncbi:MAG: hypothetical protein ACP59X_02380 [Solidesulfovibrio sp. DCME]|uniref:hypothetical protein n=1 Tax=Solidesulfovibrio sp. DCME TaxID=3447380 RepID=UPI003D144492